MKGRRPLTKKETTEPEREMNVMELNGMRDEGSEQHIWIDGTNSKRVNSDIL